MRLDSVTRAIHSSGWYLQPRSYLQAATAACRTPASIQCLIGLVGCSCVAYFAWSHIAAKDFGSLPFQLLLLAGALTVGLLWQGAAIPRAWWAARASRVFSHPTAGAVPQAETIGTLQVLRGIAALSVAFYHTDFRLGEGRHVDFQGVSIFFVISGFIMTYISRVDSDDFVRKRLIRIVPVYWFATIVTLLWGHSGLFNPPDLYPALAHWALHEPINILRWLRATLVSISQPDTVWQIVRSLAFIPSEKLPVIGVGWTLNIEMFFYMSFAAMLTLSRSAAPLLTCAILWVMMYLNRNADCGSVCSVYGHDYVRFFIYGVACYYVWRWIDRFAASWRRLTILVSLLALSYWILARLFLDNATDLEHAWLPPIVVLATLALHSAGIRCGRGLLVFGAASYALYLMHPITIETFRSMGREWPATAPDAPPGMILALAASAIVALAVHFYFEVPVTRHLRRGGLSTSISKTRFRIRHGAKRLEAAAVERFGRALAVLGTKRVLGGYALLGLLTLGFQLYVRPGCRADMSCSAEIAKALVWSAVWPASWFAYLSGTHYIQDVYRYLLTEWRAVAHAPITIIMLSILLFGLAARAVRWRYLGLVNTLTERLRARDQRIAEYERRLASSSHE